MRTFTSLAQVEDAIESNDFDENHYLEAKRELKLKSTKDKLELTRDLAQFAFDGGTIVFGVAEDKETQENRFSLAPFAISDGLREQIEQIVADRACPPLSVRVTPIEAEVDSGEGVVVVEVPPSSRVPHMVDGKYPSRGEASRRYLDDSEVRLWIGRGEDALARVEAVLDEHIQQDPCPAGSAENAHVFGVAVPLTSRYDDLPEMNELMTDLNDASHKFLQGWVNRFGNADSRARGPHRNLDLFNTHQRHPRSHEVAMRSHGLHLRLTGSDNSAEERNLSEWSVDNRGGIRIYDAGFSISGFGDDSSGEKWTSSIYSVEAAGMLVELAKISAHRMGYRGEWGFGFGATGMRGVRRSTRDHFSYPTIVDRDEMRTAAVVSGYELESDPGAVLDRLAGPMLRMLGDEQFLKPTR